MIELIGVLYKIGIVRNRNGFIFREVAFKCIDNKGLEQPVRFLLNFNDTKIIEQYQVGQKLQISYYHQGKEFENHNADELGIVDNKIIVKLSELSDKEDKTKVTKKVIDKFSPIPFGEEEEVVDLTRTYEEFPKELIY